MGKDRFPGALLRAPGTIFLFDETEDLYLLLLPYIFNTLNLIHYKNHMNILSKNPKMTASIGEYLAKEILGSSRKNAFVIALHGDLGSGKTTFTKGFMKGLSIQERVQSPTFVLMKRFLIPQKKKSQFLRAIHIDCYRLKNQRSAEKIGIKDDCKNSENIILIEWAERIQKLIPKDHLSISFDHVSKNERKITIQKNI